MAKGDRWIFDKIEDREYSREEKIARLKKLVEYHKTIKGGRKKGYLFINNGVEQKVQHEDLPIPEGWKRGYLKRSAK